MHTLPLKCGIVCLVMLMLMYNVHVYVYVTLREKVPQVCQCCLQKPIVRIPMQIGILKDWERISQPITKR